MEILILIGIFAFVIAIIFRSNEALDRVGEVEKEVKAIEDELGHHDEAQKNIDAIPTEQSPIITSPVAVQGTEQLQTEKELQHTESEPEVQFSAVQSASALEPDSHSPEQSLPDMEHIQPVEPNSFPPGNSIRMS